MTVLYGEWYGGGGWPSASAIAAREADMGHRLDIIHWWDEIDQYYDSMVDQIVASGRIPMVSIGWPIGFSNTNLLQSWGQGIAALKPALVYLRLMWEFNDPECQSNGDFHPWPLCGHTTSQMVNTWKYIVNTIRSQGANNARFVWNPDGTLGYSAMYGDSNGSAGLAYAGDAYIDFSGFDAYTGFDSYNVGDVQFQYDAVKRQTGSSKPMCFGEAGGSDHSNGAGLANDLSARLNDGRMPLVQSVVWFNDDPADPASIGFAKNPQMKAAVKAMLQTPAFQGGVAPPPPPVKQAAICSSDS